MSSNQNPKILNRPTKGDENANSPRKAKDVEILSDNTVNQKPRVSRIVPSTKEKRVSRPAAAPLQEQIPRQPALSPHPNALSTEEESAGRPSRRRGAVVSYAEPNLRDKMRRPTKELTDAVAFGSRRSSSFQPGRESFDHKEDHGHIQSQDSLSAGFVPAEQSFDLLSKDNSSEQLPTMVSRRRRKMSSTQKDENDAGHSSCALQKEIENSLADISAQVSQESLGSRRQTRRHSSNPKRTTANMAQYDGDQGESPSPNEVGDSPEDEDLFRPGPNVTIDVSQVRRGQRIGARRKSMMV